MECTQMHFLTANTIIKGERRNLASLIILGKQHFDQTSKTNTFKLLTVRGM